MIVSGRGHTRLDTLDLGVTTLSCTNCLLIINFLFVVFFYLKQSDEQSCCFSLQCNQAAASQKKTTLETKTHDSLDFSFSRSINSLFLSGG